MRKVIVGLVAVGSLLAACGGGDGDHADTAAEGTSTTKVGQTTTTVGQTTTTTQAGPAPTCSYTGTDPDFGYMQVELSFTNTLGEVNDPEATYALLDGEGGTRFFTGTAGGLDLADLHFPRVNEQFRMPVDTREKLPPNIDATSIHCRVLKIEEGTDIGGYKRASGAETCTVVAADKSRARVDVAAISPYDKTTKVQVWWAMQAPGNLRFATGTNVVDLVGAGEKYRFTEDTRGIPAWVAAGSVTCTVVGYWDQDR